MVERVQLSRAKGWRMPPNTVRVARPGKWGNKFKVGDMAERFSKEHVYEMFKVRDAAMAVACFEEWIGMHLAHHPEIMRPALDELRGKNLACWCGLGSPCHADVLLRLANSKPPNDEVQRRP